MGQGPVLRLLAGLQVLLLGQGLPPHRVLPYSRLSELCCVAQYHTADERQTFYSAGCPYPCTPAQCMYYLLALCTAGVTPCVSRHCWLCPLLLDLAPERECKSNVRRCSLPCPAGAADRVLPVPALSWACCSSAGKGCAQACGGWGDISTDMCRTTLMVLLNEPIKHARGYCVGSAGHVWSWLSTSSCCHCLHAPLPVCRCL
jgi:hypothetical protein